MNKTVLVPIADGTEELEAIAIIDILRRAGAHLTVASVSELQITASRGTRIVADKLLTDCTGTAYDLIVLPGGLPGSEHLRDSKELATMLRSQAAAGKLYAAICAAPVVVLHHHGLIGKKHATSFPSMQKQLENPDTACSKVVVDGNLVTSCGAGTAIEFALKLVELLFGIDKRSEIAKAIVLSD